MVRYVYGHSSILVLLTLTIFSIYSAHEISWSILFYFCQTKCIFVIYGTCTVIPVYVPKISREIA